MLHATPTLPVFGEESYLKSALANLARQAVDLTEVRVAGSDGTLIFGTNGYESVPFGFDSNDAEWSRAEAAMHSPGRMERTFYWWPCERWVV